MLHFIKFVQFRCALIHLYFRSMEILQKLTQNNFNQVAKLIENSQIPEELMSGNLKNELKKYRFSYSTPASITQAIKHQRVIKFGYRPPTRRIDQQTCGCCGFRIENQQIPICQSVEPSQKKPLEIQNFNQHKLPSMVVYYFTFIKSCILLIFLNLLIHSIFNLLTSQIYGKTCQSLKNCKKTIWNTLSVANKYGQDQFLLILDILGLVAIVIMIVFFILNRRKMYRLRILIECQMQSQADYSLFISNIPLLQFPTKEQQSKKSNRLQFFYRKHLQLFFQKLIKQWFLQKSQWVSKKDKIGLQLQQLMDRNNGQLRRQQIIKSVSLCYNLSRLEVIQQIKAGIIESFQNHNDDGTSLLSNEQGESMYTERFSSIPERINFLNDCELILNGQFARDTSFLFSVTHFCGCAFISFEYSHYKNLVQRISRFTPSRLSYNGNLLKIQEAAYPTDIYWQNIKISEKQRRKKTLSSCLMLALILGFSFIGLLGLQLLKLQVFGSWEAGFANSVIPHIFTVFIVIFIMFINYVLTVFAKILTISQKRITQTDYSFSVLIKQFTTKFINTILLFLFLTILINRKSDMLFMEQTGFIFQISALLVISGILYTINALIFPEQLCRRFQRWWKYRNFQNNVQRKFQRTLNKQYEYPEFQFPSRYSYLLVTIHALLFYSYIVPLGVLVGFAVFFMQYWIDKYILLKRSSLKYHFSFNLSKWAIKVLQSSVLSLSLGNLVFSTYLHNCQVNIINIVGFGIAGAFTLFLWIAPQKVEAIIFGQSEYNQKNTYDDCLNDGKFEATYWTQNPATFLIEQEKVTGRKKVVNPALNRKSIEGEVFLSSFNN